MTERIELPCPACAEPILAAAKKCKHCGAQVEEARTRFAPQACPSCAEMTATDSGRCTFCNEPLTAAEQPWTRPSTTTSAPPNVRVGNAGASASASPARAAQPLQVGFGQAFALGFENFANFDGRATRGEYWWLYLGVLLLYWGASVVGAILFGAGSDGWLMMYGLVVLVLMVPSLSSQVRRLHDTGRSGWWVLLVFTIIGIIPLIVWLASEGEAGPNAYGPPRTS